MDRTKIIAGLSGAKRATPLQSRDTVTEPRLQRSGCGGVQYVPPVRDNRYRAATPLQSRDCKGAVAEGQYVPPSARHCFRAVTLLQSRDCKGAVAEGSIRGIMHSA